MQLKFSESGHGEWNVQANRGSTKNELLKYSVILSVLDPRKCENLEDYTLDFEHAHMDSGGENFQQHL